MPATWARARAAGGFTLLELLVVLAIIASLTAAFPLALNRFVPARRVDAAARDLLADIRLAQARSINTDAVVVLVPAEHGYDLRGTEVGGPALQERRWRQSTSLELSSVDGSRPVSELRVYPDGSSSGGRFVIRDGTRERSVTVSELTGRARLGVPAAGPAPELGPEPAA